MKYGHEQESRFPIEVDTCYLRDRLKTRTENPLFLLDVREPNEFRDWRIDSSINVPLGILSRNVAENHLPKEIEMVTICRTGVRSLQAAEFLRRNGFSAESLRGGLVSWSRTYDEAVIPTPHVDGLRILQLRRLGKGCVSYIILHKGQCIVVDPTSHIEEFVRIARREQAKITHVIDTHQHADHISGARSLAQSSNAFLMLNSKDRYSFGGFLDLKDGMRVMLGDTCVSVIHSPGHTHGSVMLNVESEFLLTGDTLFLSGIARPDLRGEMQQLTHELYLTYRDKVLPLPGHLCVLPGHTELIKQGDLGVPVKSSLSDLLDRFPVLQLLETEFLKTVMKSLPAYPPNHMSIMRINGGEISYDPEVADLLEEGPNNCVVKVVS